MAAGAHLHSIVLTEQERMIFRLLQDVVDHYLLGTQLRVAGGWVRDKLLGNDSDDIDIALDNMTGQEFVQKVKDYLELIDKEQKRVGVSQWYANAIFITLIKYFRRFLQHFWPGGRVRYKLDNMVRQNFRLKVKEYSELMGEKQEEDSSKKKKKGGGVIRCNPDKSKHLETATMRIFRIPVDFVNLRSEKYADNSRIPIVEGCSAKEDAFRRDLTINSLFYNITTKSVEDLTERGLEDLNKGLIDTPSLAKATFLDDPLRVLRAIRFAARFGFTLAEDLKEAASDERVKSDLCSKISRERIGKEVDLLMKGKHPVNAMCYIRDLGLFYVVFAFPQKPDPAVADKHDWFCVSHIEAAWNLAQLIGCSIFKGDSDSKSQRKRILLYSALFSPIRNMVYMDDKSEKVSIVSYIIRNSLKLEADASTNIISVYAASEKFAELIIFLESNGNVETFREKLNDEFLEIPTDLVNRVLAGLLLCEIKDFWRVALLIYTLSYPQVGSFSHDELHRRKEKYVRVERLITDLGLEDVWEMKPLLHGDEIQRVLQVPKGPLVGKWKRRALKWQLAHPEGTKEECEKWVKRSQQTTQKVEM